MVKEDLELMEPNRLLRFLFAEAVSAADPMKTIPKTLPKKPKGKIFVLGVGKASARMAEAVESIWGPCSGIVLTKYGYSRRLKGIEVVEANHPIPDLKAFQTTDRIIKFLKTLREDDFLLILLSGGGSALLSAPGPGLSYKDKQIVHEMLLKCGAPISKINLIRKHLSEVKGGKIAALAYPAKILCLAISDVPGDNIADIASGITVGEDSTPDQALEILTKYNIKLPKKVREKLAEKSTTLSTHDKRLSNVKNKIISAPSQSLKATVKAAKKLGYNTVLIGDLIEGEAKIEAIRQADMAIKIQAGLKVDDKPVILISGGECTVSVSGTGKGGPNAEFALSAAIHLNGKSGIHLIACDTDGIDGFGDAAGAIVGPKTLQNAIDIGLNAKEMLMNHDSHTFFSKIDSQVISGPTLTNVNDFRAFLIQRE